MIMRLSIPKKMVIACSLALAIIISGWEPTLAGDPFRKSNPRNIGERTEAAFDALFKQGNYKEAKQYVIEATEIESSEPLAHAMRASLAFTDDDLDTLKVYSQKTIKAAEGLKTQDPLRSNLYLAAGTFLEGTYIFQKDGADAAAAVAALPRLQQVFQYLEAAEKISPNDPELNLLKGYLDLMLAVHLPFSSPEQAIERLQSYAAPEFLVDRGIALAYRDLKDYDKALQYMDEALAATPDNPELLYLKGQILRSKGNKDKNPDLLRQALDYFNRALEKQDQLPPDVLKQLKREHGKIPGELSAMEGSAS